MAQRIQGAVERERDRDAEWVGQVRRKLVEWYEQGHRELPWRSGRDPYHILVSEMMLVQTTVAAVIPYYERFLARFPTVRDLAEAEEAEVLKLWEGLGYYRRARQLHAAARAIVHRHGGCFPRDAAEVRALPGVGRYIAGAILSFAFDQPAPIVEANTERVLARLIAWEQNITSSASKARLWQAAERLVPPVGTGQFNQAIMELGAVVCTPRSPLCLVCPVSAECEARGRGIQDSLPSKPPRQPPLAVSEACALVVKQGNVLIARRSTGGLWAGFWEFPTVHLAGADPAGRSFGEPIGLAEGVRRLTGVRATLGPAVRSLRYSVTKHRVELAVHAGVGQAGPLEAGPGLCEVRWAEPSALDSYPFGSAGRRLATWVNEMGAAGLEAHAGA